MVGRPILHGLAVDGQPGVEKVLNVLKRELTLNMALAGAARWCLQLSQCVLPGWQQQLGSLGTDKAAALPQRSCWPPGWTGGSTLQAAARCSQVLVPAVQGGRRCQP